MTSDYRAVGAAIADEFKALRSLSRGYCPQCQRLVAAIVMYEGEPWLYVKGGVVRTESGNHSWWRARAESRQSDANSDPVWQASADRYREGAEQLQREPRSVYVPDMAQPVRLLETPKRDEIRCPHCRRNLSITVHADGTLELARHAGAP